MSDKRSRRPRLGMQAGGSGVLSALDEDAMVQVLHAAKAARILGLLASSSSYLCDLARSRIPVQLYVSNEQLAGFIIRSHTSGRGPFSGCTTLSISADSLAMCCMSVGVLSAMQHWTGLQELTMFITPAAPGQPLEPSTMEYCTASILGGVAALQQLRRLELHPRALGACGMSHVLQLTQLTALKLSAYQTPTHTAVDHMALARLTNLVELRLDWALAPPLPDGPEGPYCLPTSLVTLELDSAGPAPMAFWLAHVPGCVQLQCLEVRYHNPQHHSTHPRAVVELLLQHKLQVRDLWFLYAPHPVDFSAHVPGLPDAEGAEGAADWRWRPHADLAALSRLESLSAYALDIDTLQLHVEEEADWQRLAQVPRLRQLNGVECSYVPPHPAGTTLSLLELTECVVHMGGYQLGRLLLACPLLHKVRVMIMPPGDPAVMGVPAAGVRLPPHPTLKDVKLRRCDVWGDAAAAAAEFSVLTPVLSRVGHLEVQDWPAPSTRMSLPLPDLSCCLALTGLEFQCDYELGAELQAEQEDFLSMLAPLVQLRSLWILDADRVNGRIVVPLQYMLPRLQSVELLGCGRLLRVAGGDMQQEEVEAAEQQATEKVKQLLRAGLHLELNGYADDAE